MKRKAGLQERFRSRCQLSVLVPMVLLVGLGPRASAKRAPASENSRLPLQVYNAGVKSPVLAPPSGARLTLGFILAGGLRKLCQDATSDPREANPTITIHGYNYAEAFPKALLEAQRVATNILRRAGVGTQWLDRHLTSEKKQEDWPKPKTFHSGDIALHILPRSMTDSFGVTGERLGFAPGQGPNRGDVYVFYDRAEQMTRLQRAAQLEDSVVGIVEPHATVSQILGHVIAHELGHLLGLASHSSTGIMRADWGSADLQDAIHGRLLFTPEQAGIIRAEVTRRTGLHGIIQQDRTAVNPRAEQYSVQRERN